MSKRVPGRAIWRSRRIHYLLITIGALAGVLLYLLALASDNTPLFDRYYPVLLGLNITIGLAMLGFVAMLIWRLVSRYRAGVFGARLMVRFALSFALMGLVPGALIYLVSVQFLSRSIESWFNVRVDSALESGLTLGRAALDSLLDDLNIKARSMALDLSDVSEGELSGRLIRLREQTGVQEATLFTLAGRVVASARSTRDSRLTSFMPELPPPPLLRQLRSQPSYSAVETPEASDGDKGSDGKESTALRLRVVVQLQPHTISLSNTNIVYLQLLQQVPTALASNAEAVQNGMRDYQELSYSRTGLRRIYTVTLTITLLLAVFAALAVAFVLAGWLTEPLLLLAEGTKAVAGGDYRPMDGSHSRDELGSLTLSFNAMVRQLAEARAAVEHNNIRLENAKTYLESILANLSAGVLVFDEAFHLATANHGAERILAVDLLPLYGQTMTGHAVLQVLGAAIERAFAEHSETPDSGRDWQKQIELDRSGAADAASHAVPDRLILLARGSRCPVNIEGDDRPGYLVVFDDISDVISAQRSLAWGEVARRLAHEIKNPLTPIQLSAERLRMKLGSKLDSADGAVLERGVTMIVNQVTAMKHMVDDFRDYARVVPAQMVPINLNDFVGEVLAMYEQSGGPDISTQIAVQLGSDVPTIIGDVTRLRQVIHNLVQNAQDSTQGRPDALVSVVTERVAIRSPSGTREVAARLTVSDNGSGFPARILARAFEPYVTTKVRGTGLGLAVVKKIADEHEARIDLRNRDEGGASIALLFTKIAASPASTAAIAV